MKLKTNYKGLNEFHILGLRFFINDKTFDILNKIVRCEK